MENQPTPVRPWFRLASQARMELQPPAPQPQPQPPRPAPPVPRIPLLRAALSQIQAQAPPPPPPPAQPAVAAPPPSPPRLPQPVVAPQPTPSPPLQLPRQPLQPVAAPQPTPSPPPDRLRPSPAAEQAASVAAAESQQPPPPSPRPTPPSRTITPPQSPKVIRPSLPTPPPSPRYSQPQRATSPQLSYPQPEPEPQLRGRFIREVSGGNGNGNGNGKGNGVTKPMANDIKEQSQVDMRAPPPPPSPRREEATAPKGTAATQDRKPVKEVGEMKLITMAGENIGAYMEFGSSSHRRHPLHSLHNRKQHQNVQPSHQGNELAESGTAVVSDDGNHGEEKTAKAKGMNTGSREGKPMATALVNSNVQSVNNSILFNSSCSEHSPGVHVTLSSHRKPKGNSLHKGH